MLPETFWHCYVKSIAGKASTYHIENDLTFDEIKRKVIDPWNSGKPFALSGFIIRSTQDIPEIKIVQTERDKNHYAEMHNAKMRSSGIVDMSTNRAMLPFGKGHDYTFELLFENSTNVTPDSQTDLVVLLCSRLKKSAQILGNRTRKGKKSYEITDEYDVQDLLQALLRALLKYSVSEDPIGKVAGTKSARADISIEELGIIIEVKYVRTPSDQRAMFEQYSEDLVLYSKWDKLKTLIYMIYNSDDLSDPESLEKLSGVQSINGKAFESKIILA